MAVVARAEYNINNIVKHVNSACIGLSIFFSGNAIVIKTDEGDKILLRTLDGDKEFYRLRDSAIFRAECVIHHNRLLTEANKRANEGIRDVERMEKSITDFKTYTSDLMRWTAREQTYFAEDVTLHLTSFFEYVGNIIGYVYGGKHAKKTKWKGAESYAFRDKARRELRNVTQVFEATMAEVRKHHTEFVNELQELRAHAFHYVMNFAPAESSVSLMNPEESRITVKAPASLFKYVTKLRPNDKRESIELAETMEILAVEGLVRGAQILLQLQGAVQFLNQQLGFWAKP